MTRRTVPSSGGGGGAAIKGLVDAKGDLLAGTADNTLARLAVGANDTALVADSAETTGVKWAALTGAGGVASSVIWRGTAATATAGNLVSTTPEADADANASISYGALSLRTDRSGYKFVSAGRGGASQQVSAWKLDFTMPASRRFVISGTLGARTADIQPLVMFGYQDITHYYSIYRNTTTAIDGWARNNSGTAVLYAGSALIGLNSGFGGDFEIVCDFSPVADGPIGSVSVRGQGTGNTNTWRNSFGTGTSGDLLGAAAPHASWASGPELTVAIGCGEITGNVATAELWNLVIRKHPADL